MEIEGPLLQRGIDVANRSYSYFRHGAIVFRDGKILSTSYNYNNVHAEVAALLKIPKPLRKNVCLLSVRVTRSGEQLAHARPCQACMKFMEREGVSVVFYSTPRRTIEAINISVLGRHN